MFCEFFKNLTKKVLNVQIITKKQQNLREYINFLTFVYNPSQKTVGVFKFFFPLTNYYTVFF